MKVLTLDKCEYLTHIPDVSGLQNLEKFSFAYCRKLITIHNSIGHLNKLERLSAYGCSKLERFPPLGLASLNELDLSFCESLKNFPKLLCKMTNIKEIGISYTSIGELPSSFQNLNELDELSVVECGMMRFPKQNDQMYSIVFSNLRKLSLSDCNLSDECLPIFLKWCVNVKLLDLSWNNFKFIPECLSECYLLNNLRLDNCKSLEEIRGIPPNLERLSAMGCKSLSSSSRRMLLSQKLHEAGCNIRFPNFSDGIPDWFEHQSRGDTISFWFCKKIPSIISIILFPGCTCIPEADLFVNGYKCFLSGSSFCGFSLVDILESEHSFLFDVKLEEQIKHLNLISEMDKALLKNEWIHVELNFVKNVWNKSICVTEKLSSAQMGIHVRKEKSNAEENVIFTDPHRGYRNTSLSQFEPPLKKQRLVEVVVSETEIWQQQHLALLSLQQQMALLPQQQRITVLSGMWNLVLSETKQSTSKKKHAEVGVSETEILQQQHLALVSGMQNLVLTETNEEHLC
ncbi:disease resistance-like protein CSA1 [Medicago truncatula]|uniref:disease resistance-like protein CSA1 n=1 Tax=Medicago truncatula TaxID=3880 RepID=UPI0019676924|nr:disease resistance-like protein CSA1 [Medicago truncatula]